MCASKPWVSRAPGTNLDSFGLNPEGLTLQAYESYEIIVVLIDFSLSGSVTLQRPRLSCS
jgi:hypothetical protein